MVGAPRRSDAVLRFRHLKVNSRETQNTSPHTPQEAECPDAGTGLAMSPVSKGQLCDSRGSGCPGPEAGDDSSPRTCRCPLAEGRLLHPPPQTSQQTGPRGARTLLLWSLV